MKQMTFMFALVLAVFVWMVVDAACADAARLSFTTPTGVADSTCAPIPGVRIEDLAWVHVYHRRYGDTADTTWVLYATLAVADTRGGEVLSFDYDPPGPGWWSVMVAGANVAGEACPSNVATFYANPCPPARVTDLRPEP